MDVNPEWMKEYAELMTLAKQSLEYTLNHNPDYERSNALVNYARELREANT